MIVVDAEKIAATRPDRPLFTDLSITVETGDRLGVVGINGCGKSTLLRMLSGEIAPETGTIRRGRGTHVVFLPQEPILAPGTVRTSVIAGLENAQTWDAEAVLDRLGMGALLDADVSTLSGGQAKRVALARVLVSDADLVILDEPTNHLDLDAIAWLEDRLARVRSGLIMVTHDRHVLDRVCTKVLEIDRGTGYVHSGRAASPTASGSTASTASTASTTSTTSMGANVGAFAGAVGGYQAYLEGRAEREERAAASEATRRNLAKTELAWLRRGAPARTRKPKAHIESATALIEAKPQAAARSGALDFGAALGRSGEGQGRTAGSLQGSFRQGNDERLAPRLGTKVIELHGIGHRFEANNWASSEDGWLFRDLEWLLEPAGRYGVVGSNGSGKSTLLEIMSGRLTPAAGTVEVGPTVRLGYYDQLAREFDPEQRVREAVAGTARPAGTPEDKKLMEQFWFDDDLQWAQIGTLSGGERRRLQLLLVLAQRPNVLLLDEPTNDLDLDTLRMIEQFLEDWPGTLVVISHDRAFMDRTVEEVFAIENGRAALVSGGYAGWRENRASNLRMVPSTDSKPSAQSPQAKPTSGAVSNSSNSSPSSLRSSSTLRFLMKENEKALAKATKQRDAAQTLMDAAVAGGDHQAMATAGETLATAQAEVDAAEETWLELAAEAER